MQSDDGKSTAPTRSLPDSCPDVDLEAADQAVESALAEVERRLEAWLRAAAFRAAALTEEEQRIEQRRRDLVAAQGALAESQQRYDAEGEHAARQDEAKLQEIEQREARLAERAAQLDDRENELGQRQARLDQRQAQVEDAAAELDAQNAPQGAERAQPEANLPESLAEFSALSPASASPDGAPPAQVQDSPDPQAEFPAEVPVKEPEPPPDGEGWTPQEAGSSGPVVAPRLCPDEQEQYPAEFEVPSSAETAAQAAQIERMLRRLAGGGREAEGERPTAAETPVNALAPGEVLPAEPEPDQPAAQLPSPVGEPQIETSGDALGLPVAESPTDEPPPSDVSSVDLDPETARKLRVLRRLAGPGKSNAELLAQLAAREAGNETQGKSGRKWWKRGR